MVGVILLSAMTVAGFKIWLNNRKTTLEQLKEKSESQPGAD